MKRGLAAAIFAALAAHTAAQEPASFSPLTQPVHGFRMPKQLPPCGLEAVLLLVAKETGVRIGFERTTDCQGRKALGFPEAYKPLNLADAEVLDGVPVKEVLGRAAALVPDYDWAIMEGVAVFRPSEAWKDKDDPLTARVPPLRFSQAPVAGILAAILNLPARQGRPAAMSIDFQAGRCSRR